MGWFQSHRGEAAHFRPGLVYSNLAWDTVPFSLDLSLPMERPQTAQETCPHLTTQSPPPSSGPCKPPPHPHHAWPTPSGSHCHITDSPVARCSNSLLLLRGKQCETLGPATPLFAPPKAGGTHWVTVPGAGVLSLLCPTPHPHCAHTDALGGTIGLSGATSLPESQFPHLCMRGNESDLTGRRPGQAELPHF